MHLKVTTVFTFLIHCHMACVVNSYASELQAIVNEPIYNGYSYFIL